MVDVGCVEECKRCGGKQRPGNFAKGRREGRSGWCETCVRSEGGAKKAWSDKNKDRKKKTDIQRWKKEKAKLKAKRKGP